MAKKLETIDFSGGIRAEKIQHNFEALEDQLARERLAIAGHGVSTGLDFTIDKFNVEINEGSLIGHNGKEVFLDAKTLEIELPRLKQIKDETYLVQNGGQIILPNIPYCLHRESAVNINSLQNGITILNYNNSGEKIKMRNIVDNVITIDNSYSGTLVKISYSYTYKRYDTIYINLDGEIKLLEGTTSSAPSIIIPEDSMYILGYVEIDPYFTVGTSKVATLKIKKDMRSLRNIFTDSNNRLFICGVPFDNLQIIHMEQPEEPFINQLWYDSVANKLKVWVELDGIEQWVNVNDDSTIPVEEVKMWEPDENPADGKYFIFKPDEIQYHFVPNRNCLDIRIDQGVLHKDQFDEVTLSEAKTNKTLRDYLIANHGYTEEFIQSIDEEYENIGVGFVLGSPLDKKCYVEALVHHRVHENPLSKRFQRTATFVARNYYRISNTEKLFTLNEYYRYGENQLELFLDGKRLELGIDYVEGNEADYIYENNVLTYPKKGKALNTFLIKRDLPSNSILSYKITTSIYSYDHVEQVVGNLGDRIDAAELTANNAKTEVQQIQASVNTQLSEIKSDVRTLKENDKEHSNFIKTTDKIGSDNLSPDIVSKLHKGFINKTFTKTASQVVLLDGIEPEDFIIAFDMSKSTGNNILKRIEDDAPQGDGDYYIERSAGQVKMMFKSASTVSNGSSIYITGMKF